MARVCGVLNKRIIRLSANPDGFGRVADPLDEQAFLSEVPTQHTHYFWEDDDTGLYVGVWDTTSMIETAGPYPCDEFMWLLEGSLSLHDENDELHHFKAGDAFFLEQGTVCRWSTAEHVSTAYAIVRNTPAKDTNDNIRGINNE